MAEFKLGRIRFIWKDEWSENTTYYKDDVVRYGGRTFMCVVGHIAQTDFMLDLNDSTPKWQQFADGQTWRGDWATGTVYKINDIVKYGGQLYIANTGHISDSSAIGGLESNLGDDSTSAYWDLFGEGFDYKGDWAISTRYKVNDIVKYGAKLYICTTYHSSTAVLANGLELDQNKWDTFSDGFDWKTDWAVNTRYKVNDLVKYGGQVYSCNTGHTSAATNTLGLEADQAKWDYFHKGIEYLGDWTSATRYKVNDVVKDSGTIWICTTYHTSSVSENLTPDEANWSVFIPGLEFEDTWGPYSEYQVGDIVTYGGYTYVAKTNNSEKKPAESPNDWDVFITGFNLRGEWGSDSTNQDYKTGDVVTLGGYTYLATANSNGQQPPNTSYWEKLNEGFNFRAAWANGTAYVLGDTVTHGVNAYVCVDAHTADQVTDQNRPDQDTAGDYWNFFSGGTEAGNLTTAGDIVYYGGSGPTRLPVGKPGQVLKVNDAADAPEWTYFGQINHVYYVDAENGVDDRPPKRGITLDRPYKTVRYAADWIEKGANSYEDKYLMEVNRAFMQAEVVEWVDYQIANVISPFTGSFSYNKEKCRRDTGIIIDAIMWDLSHGGNVRSREAALAYFTTGGLSYINGQEDETVAAINYLETVIGNVLNKEDPAANYQTLNSVASPITQIKPSGFDKTTGVNTTIANLIDIITNAITAGNTNGVPAILKAQKTIFVKTGEYLENHPIRVPEDTAVVGDELRSTRIKPAPSSVDTSDITYSLAAIGRLRDVVSDVITNTSITKSTGNAESQVTSRPAGNAGSDTARDRVKDMADTILDILDGGEGFTGREVYFSDPGVDNNKRFAREQLQANRAFMVAEITAWLAVNYAGIVTDTNAFEKEIGYAIDAASYDVQYGGNSATHRHNKGTKFDPNGAPYTPSGQKTAVAAAYGRLATIASQIVQETAVTKSTGNSETQDTSGTAASSTEGTEVSNLLTNIQTTVNAGNLTGQDTETTPVITWASSALQSSHTELQDAKAEIANHTVHHVKASQDFVFNETLCNRDSQLMVDAISYDMAFNTNYRSVTAGNSYYRVNASAQKVYNDQLVGQKSAVRHIRAKAALIAANGAGAEAFELLDMLAYKIDAETSSSGDVAPIFCGTNTPETATTHTYAVEILEQNKDFLVAEVHAYIGVQYPSYTYDIAACSRDVRNYIDGLKYDLIYTGNYSTLMNATFYANAVNGSILYDMFYMRNGTGLRNCTTSGLTGTLGAANSYGTKRPTAGAYVSLDPGYNPYDTRVHITNKSPYVQNVSTFGTACIGMKVDGDLHQAGNDSIVANDFTQILSDGIGYWVTNLGRSELVSVFTYYCHMGYLAENGGKIRATNGNNSYGDFGSVAEGIDDTEVPVTGEVDNQQLEAIISFVQTDGADEILQLEYQNAGQGYTNTSTAILTVHNVSGNDANRTAGTYKGITGSSAGSGTGQEFDVEVSSTGGATVTVIKGGTGHAISDTITINDSSLGGGGGANLTFDVQTIGEATRYTISGEGFGAAVSGITLRDGGVFEVQLESDSTVYGGDGFLTTNSAAQAGNATSITLAATDVQPTGAYNGMMLYIVSGLGAGQYGVITSFNASTKIATIEKESDGSSGFEHITGAAIEATLDATSQYDITPRIIFDAPASGTRARGRARVADEKVVEVKIIEPGSGYDANNPPQMTVVDPNATVLVPHTVRVGDGVLGQPTFSNRGTGFVTASATVVGDGLSDIRQSGTKIRVDNLDAIPQKGANVEFASRPNTWYKLVSVTSLVGAGPYSAILQISPKLEVDERPPHQDAITIRRRYSQVRLTGHDFLDIGTGNFGNTNYPGDPLSDPLPDRETNDFGGGRVFYTSTDQDGNFRVGGLFNVEQATGIATLNVEAFNISGLNELQLGSVALGGAGAVITEFSTDGTFSADSDSIVPTQKAIKTYITSQIGGGVATLNVNSVTAGVIEITGDTISTTSDAKINIEDRVNFTGGIDGAPVALNMFLLN